MLICLSRYFVKENKSSGSLKVHSVIVSVIGPSKYISLNEYYIMQGALNAKNINTTTELMLLSSDSIWHFALKHHD